MDGKVDVETKKEKKNEKEEKRKRETECKKKSLMRLLVAWMLQLQVKDGRRGGSRRGIRQSCLRRR